MKALFLRNVIDLESLFSSTTYKTNFYDKCIYCHKNVENDYFEYEKEYVGQPYRCNCENAKKELEEKEKLFRSISKLQENVDYNKINVETKKELIEAIDRAYNEKFTEGIKSFFD